jgi:hypothetical protein
MQNCKCKSGNSVAGQLVGAHVMDGIPQRVPGILPQKKVLWKAYMYETHLKQQFGTVFDYFFVICTMKRQQPCT